MLKSQPEKRNSGFSNNIWSLGLVLALVVSFTLVSPITSAQENSSTLPEETINKIESIDGQDFVYVFSNPLDGFRVTKLIEGAKITAEEIFDLNVKFFGPEESHDDETVLAMLEEIVAQSPRGIAMEIGHPSKFDDIIGEAVDKGIYFVGFSVDDWTANPRQGYVGYEWEIEGKKLADALFKQMPPRSKILVLDSVNKQGRSRNYRLRGITDRLKEFNFDYSIITVKPEKEDVKQSLLDYMEDEELVGIVSIWGEITRQLGQVMDHSELRSVRAGGFGCGELEKFVKSGKLDVLMKVVTDLEGGIPLLNLYYSSLYEVTPSDIQLHAKLINSK